MLRYILLLGILLDPLEARIYPRVKCSPGEEDIYGYNATLLDQTEMVNFSRYKGKMNSLAEEFGGETFETLSFPCNQFGGQEPGANYDEIINGVKYVRPGGGFVANTTYFEKIDTNGRYEHPLYTFLKANCPIVSTTLQASGLYYEPKRVGDINWNFEKFLVGKDGKPYTRYHPTNNKPSSIASDIEYLLNQPDSF